MVAENGWTTGGGYFEACHGYADLFEIRVKVSKRLGRVYCTVDGGRLVLLSGLVKREGEATPRAVLDEAAAYLQEYKRTRSVL